MEKTLQHEQPKWEKWAQGKKPSMKRRCQQRNYTQRGIYMITMVTEGRRPLLGTLEGDYLATEGDNRPHVVLSPLGQKVKECWMSIARYHKEIEVMRVCVMPDHIHGVLFVHEEMERHLGFVIGGFKAGTHKAARELGILTATVTAAVPQFTEPSAEEAETGNTTEAEAATGTETGNTPGAGAATGTETGNTPGAGAATGAETGNTPGAGAATGAETGNTPGAGAATETETGKATGAGAATTAGTLGMVRYSAAVPQMQGQAQSQAQEAQSQAQAAQSQAQAAQSRVQEAQSQAQEAQSQAQAAQSQAQEAQSQTQEAQSQAQEAQSQAQAAQSQAQAHPRAHYDRQHGYLWEPGYHDRILLHKGQLKRMLDYLEDNPRRLLLKRAYPQFFSKITRVTVAGMEMEAMGNVTLLDSPVKLQVQCSRHLYPNEIEERKAWFLEQGRQGAIIVSPCISPGEAEISKACMAAGVPLVVLLLKGFPPFFKPHPRYLEACARGRLLLLAPYPFQNEKIEHMRARCLWLNDITARICQPSK